MEDTQRQPLESTCIHMLTQTCTYATKQGHTPPPKIIKRRGDGVRVKHLSYIGFYPRHQPKGKVKESRQTSGTDVLHQSIIKFCSTLRGLESTNRVILQSR